MTHEKLSVVLHDDYTDYRAVESAFAGVDACLYCLGKSVRQVSGEAEYRHITYDFAVAAARAFFARSPQAAFHFLSGEGAGVSSRFMWARVKGETERDLLPLGATCWRPALIDGMPSASEPALYKLTRPVGRALLQRFRSLYVSGDDIGRAMLQATLDGTRARVIGNTAIRDLADRFQRPVAAEQAR